MASAGTRERVAALRRLDRAWRDLGSLSLSRMQAGASAPDDEERYNRLVGRAQYFLSKVRGDVRLPYMDSQMKMDVFEFVLLDPSLGATAVPRRSMSKWKDALVSGTAAIREALGRLEAEAESSREPAGAPAPAAGARTETGPRTGALAAGESSTECFVAHEFSRQKKDDLRRAIDEALADSGLSPYYADNEVRQGHIFKDKILLKIRDTRFGIYDVSNPRKPNVFMELGAAIAMGKPCFIICAQGTRLPSDVLGLDHIEYESYVDLTRQLKAKVAKALREGP